jgi:hypothetical protein
VSTDPWRRLRIHHILIIVGLLGWMPYAMLCAYLLKKAVGTDDAIGWLLGLWMVACVANGGAIGWFRCPRCGKRFAQGRFYGNAFARRCLWCGQRAYQPIEPNDSPPKPVPY